MIYSLRSVSYDDLIKQLSPEDKIVINGCNTCIKMCGLGGTAKMNQLEAMLGEDGFQVIGKDLISYGCALNLVEKHRKDPKREEMYNQATVIIPLICEDGLVCIDYAFEDKKIIPMAKTLGTGNMTMDRGPVLTTPQKWTGLPENPQGYSLQEAAEKTGLFSDFFNRDEGRSGKEKETVSLIIDGKGVKARKNQNLLAVCLENGIDVPRLCYHGELSPKGACRLCLVKIKGRDDYRASCCVEVKEGMEVTTSDPELEHCRRIILELIIASGDHNCLTCHKGLPTPVAACELQKLIRKADITGSRYEQKAETLADDDTCAFIYYDPNKCILCGRCVRACEEVAGQSILGFINRGDKTAVAAGLNAGIGNTPCVGCKVCVQVCPTGALNEKVVYFSGEDWLPVRKYMSI